MPKTLVTGGAGFIGSHTVEHLVRRGHEVTVLDDLTGGFAGNVDQAARLVRGGVGDVRLVNDLFERERFDYVYHLAAYASEGLSHFIKRFNYDNNLIGSVNLINASVNHGVKCFVFTSSIAVYGGGADLPLTEDSPMHPKDSYGIAKLAVEQELVVTKRIFGLNYVIFRPHNVYGERQNIGDKYRNVVGIFMNQILQGKPLTIFGDGSQTRAFSYIRNVAPILAQAVEVPSAYNQVFNVGADRPHTVNELARRVARAMGVEARIEYLSARDEVADAYASHDKIRDVFGLLASHSLEEGLANMAAWVRRHGAQASQDFKEIEIRKNLPPSWA
ncbi:MAG: UDP-glucose 4-epimerase [Acidobacteriota bacterium]|jgi:UDP-glucose 4-epimerase|nr:UDP-glucose 4-epimerase [Acidobacteriota bacterium]